MLTFAVVVFPRLRSDFPSCDVSTLVEDPPSTTLTTDVVAWDLSSPLAMTVECLPLPLTTGVVVIVHADSCLVRLLFATFSLITCLELTGLVNVPVPTDGTDLMMMLRC